MGHYSFKDGEPAWGDVDKSELPMEAFAFPHACVMAGMMTRAMAMEMPKSEWKLPHHWVDSEGEMYAHRDGSRLAMQAMTSGIMGQRARISSRYRATVRAHLERHNRAREREEDEDSLTAEEIIKKLKDTESTLNIDEVVAFVQANQGTIMLLGDKLEDAEGELNALKEQIVLLQANVQAAKAEAEEARRDRDVQAQLVVGQSAVITERMDKLLNLILGRMEVLGDSQEKRDRFKTRAANMDFAQLDLEWEDVSARYNELFRVERLTHPTLPESDALWRDMSAYRVSAR